MHGASAGDRPAVRAQRVDPRVPVAVQRRRTRDRGGLRDGAARLGRFVRVPVASRAAHESSFGRVAANLVAKKRMADIFDMKR